MSKRSIRFLDHQQSGRPPNRRPDCLALSKDETILLSSCGDVVACRCRDSAFPLAAFDHHRSNHNHNNHKNNNWNGYYWDVAEQVAATCCETNCDDLSNQLRDTAFCGSSWNLVDDFSSPGGTAGEQGIQPQRQQQPQHTPPRRPRGGGGGLLGGNPADVATPFLRHPEPSPNHHRGLQGGGGYFRENIDPTFQEKAAVAFRSPPLRTVVDASAAAATAVDDDDMGSLVPIRSFDYSHFLADNGNDMLPDTPRRSKVRTTTPRVAESSSLPPEDNVLVSYASKEETFFHGIPTFLKAFKAVRITKCSAHPLGSHVLLISAVGLLYSYGLNDSGQLGIGIQTRVSGFHRGYITTPTIVTPLLENGGKAIACAAGVNHSLVVVETEERRIVKSRSFDPPSSSFTASHHHHHHQGGGTATALTTASSRSVDDTHPPTHRISSASSTETVVYHQLYGFGRNDSMKIGLISPRVALINGMEEQFEAVLLPRRVALQCRVHQCDNDNNEPPQRSAGSATARRPPLGIFDVQASAEHSSALVHRSSGDIELYTWGNATFGALGCSVPGPCVRSPTSASVVPVNVVPVPSFVASLSQSSNEEAQASSVLLDGEYPRSVSLGRRCSFVTTSLGRCFSFGTSDEGMLGLGPKVTEAHGPSEIALPIELRGEALVHVSAGASHVLACTDRGRVLAWGAKGPSGLSSPFPKESDHHHPDPAIQWSPHPVAITGKAFAKHDCQVVQVGAGYDCSVLVTETGRVLSCGKQSGRLGLGEVVRTTEPPATTGWVVPPQPLLGGLRLWHDSDDARRKRPGLKRGATIS